MKPMHGSVSLPPIDELLAEYVVLISSSMVIPADGEDYHRRCRLQEEIYRRIGPENATQRILEMQVTFRALTGAA